MASVKAFFVLVALLLVGAQAFQVFSSGQGVRLVSVLGAERPGPRRGSDSGPRGPPSPRRGPPARGPGGGDRFEQRSGGSRFEARPGDWECKSCSGRNFASRQTCFRCGAKSHVVRKKRRDPFWKTATAQYGPAEVAQDLAKSIWWLAPKPDLEALERDDLARLADKIGLDAENKDDDALRKAISARFDKFATTDDNFRAPAFNPKVKDLAPCYPEIYEPES